MKQAGGPQADQCDVRGLFVDEVRANECRNKVILFIPSSELRFLRNQVTLTL